MQVADGIARNHTSARKEETTNFEADYVFEVKRSQEKHGGSTNTLYQLVASAAAGSNKLAAVHTELESRKTNANHVHKVLRLSQMQGAAKNGIVKKQRARLDGAAARLAVLNSCSDEASASTAM